MSVQNDHQYENTLIRAGTTSKQSSDFRPSKHALYSTTAFPGLLRVTLLNPFHF